MNHSADSIVENRTSTAKGAPTTDKFADAARRALDGTSQRAEEVERKVRAGAERAQESLVENRKAAEAQFVRSRRQFEALARKRPLAVAGLAFAAGAVLAGIAALRR